MALKESNKNRKKTETVQADIHQEWVQKQPFPFIPIALFLFFAAMVFLS